MKITFIGCGHVGSVLADHLQKLGHRITLACRNQTSESVRKALRLNPQLQPEPLVKACSDAELVFLAVPFESAQQALSVVSNQLKGRIIVDCTNPVGPDLSHSLQNKQSGTDMLQSAFPHLKLVKAFSIYGYENFGIRKPFHHPLRRGGDKPVMLYCGNDPQAKSIVAPLIEEMGWRAVDAGSAREALHLEHMTLLWIKMVRVYEHKNFVYSMVDV